MQLFRAYQHPNFLGRVQLYMMISIFSIFFPLCVLLFSSGLLNTNMRKSSCMPFHYIQLPNNTEPFFCPVLPSHMLPALPWLPNPQKQTSIFKLDFLGECFYVVQKIEKCHLSSKKIGLKKRKTIAVLNINGPS